MSNENKTSKNGKEHFFTKTQSAILAVSLCAILGCSATLAIGGSMTSSGRSSDIKLVLHDDFDSPHKNVYVENADTSDYYVRITLTQFMRMRSDNTVVPEGAINTDPDTFQVRETLDDGDSQFAQYYTPVFGGTKTYIPLEKYTDDTYFTADYAIKDTRKQSEYNAYAIENGKNDMITPTGEGVISIDDFTDGYIGWVYDNDGWVYWSKPLKSGTTTSMLIGDIIPSEKATDVSDYALHVSLDATSIDNPNPFSSEDKGIISFNAKSVLGLLSDSDYFTELYKQASDFSAENNLNLPLESGISQEEYLTFMYIRSFNAGYTTTQFNIVGGAVNSDFVEYVNTNSTALNRYYSATTTVNGSDIHHEAYVMNSLMYKCGDTMLTANDLVAIGVPQSKVNLMISLLPIQAGKLMTEKQYDELSGWAGDLQTFTQYFVAKYPTITDVNDIADQAKADIGQSGTSFDSNDVAADLDAENIYAMLIDTENTNSLDSIYSTYYSLAYENRGSIFLNRKTEATLITDSLLYTTKTFTMPDPVLNMGVQIVLGSKMPWPIYYKGGTNITSTQSQGIANGFTSYIKLMQ